MVCLLRTRRFALFGNGDIASLGGLGTCYVPPARSMVIQAYRTGVLLKAHRFNV